MHDNHHAIEILREITGQPGLTDGPDDHVEVIFDETPVGFVTVDTYHLELVTPLANLDMPLDQAVLFRLLAANYLGDATGMARIAFDSGRKQIVLGERLDVRALDTSGLRERIADFLRVAAFWTAATGREMAAGSALPEPEPFSTDQFLIRV